MAIAGGIIGPTQQTYGDMEATMNQNSVTLRAVEPDDIATFYEHQDDPDAAAIAGFPSRDRAAFMAHWQRILPNPDNVTLTILVDGAVAGNIASFEIEGERDIGYWIGRAFWGRGVASAAVAQFVRDVDRRELMAHVVKHNAASVRVLEKCGFVRVGENDEEYILRIAARNDMEH